MTWVFWLSAGLIIWTYPGYPALLYALTRILPPKRLRPTLPALAGISVVVTAFNEEEDIIARVKNILSQDYPKERLQVIVASDGSNDETVERVRSLNDDRIEILDSHQRRGKALIQNEAVSAAINPIVIFTDADTDFHPSFLAKTANYFRDPEVGCVTGNLTRRNGGSTISAHEGLYWRYERKIRQWSSHLGILATGSGSCLALRKDLYKPLRFDEGEDCACPLDVVLQGYRVVYATDALSYDWPPASVSSEIRSRSRMTARNLRGTLRKWRPINFLKRPASSLGILSHRLLRWICPCLFPIALVSNALLLDEGPFYQAAFSAQSAFYLCVLAGFGLERLKRRAPMISAMFSFAVAHVGMFIGLVKAVIGRVPTVYEMPRERE